MSSTHFNPGPLMQHTTHGHETTSPPLVTVTPSDPALPDGALSQRPTGSQQPVTQLPPPQATSAWRETIVTMTAVGLGGVLGANARYVLGTWAQSAWGTAFPWGTLLINVLGSLLIGVFLTLATERLTIRPATRLFIATGILGAFTTFSTMSYELVHLLQAGALLRAGLYLLASLGLGLIAVVSGRALALAV